MDFNFSMTKATPRSGWYRVAASKEAVEEALRMASLNPAKLLRLDDRLGRLMPGYRADLVLPSRDLTVMETWVAGSNPSGS